MILSSTPICTSSSLEQEEVCVYLLDFLLRLDECRVAEPRYNNSPYEVILIDRLERYSEYLKYNL